jgi:hypothetical protein
MVLQHHHCLLLNYMISGIFVEEDTNITSPLPMTSAYLCIIFLVFIGCRQLTKLSLTQNFKKKLDMSFNPIFNDKSIELYKTCCNKVCVKLNCASNSKNIILYLCLYIEFHLMKSRFLYILEIQSELEYFVLKKYQKNI